MPDHITNAVTHTNDCPLCRDGCSDDLVRIIRLAKPVGKPMSAIEFEQWLKLHVGVATIHRLESAKADAV